MHHRHHHKRHHYASRHHRGDHHPDPSAHPGEAMGGIFGVRRPLRFLAHKLELEEDQIAKLAEIIDDLKTERAQAAVDNRRAQKLYVESFSGDVFDEAKAQDASNRRVKTTERVQQAVSSALGQLHVVLTPEQRRRMAYLIRSGAINF